MAETTADTTVDRAGHSEEEAKLDPRALAKSVVLSVADEPEEVGDFAQSIDLGDNVTDFRFVCLRKGYEGWQWAVTLYHDVEVDSWSVNESTLVPTKDSLLAPAWIPWKDRLEAADLSVTDSLGTDPDDPRMEDGFRKTEVVKKDLEEVAETGQTDAVVSQQKITDTKVEANGAVGVDSLSVTEQSGDKASGNTETGVSVATQTSEENATDGEVNVGHEAKTDSEAKADGDIDPETGLSRELEDTVERFGLSRRHVMSELGRSQTAKRWYDGQHGPKSLSTKTAEGNLCSTCAFFIGLKGDLDTMFGVCANRWSPDDGRVVSLDHGCGEHSEIEQPEPSHLWVQSKPAFDDLHIDIIAQAPREERGQVELIESIDEDEDVADTESEESDETDDETATENDIAEHAVPGSLDDDDDESDEDEDDEVIGKGTVGSEVTADVAIESTIDLSDADDSEDDADDSDSDSTDGDSDDDATDDASNDSDDSDDSDDSEVDDSEDDSAESNSDDDASGNDSDDSDDTDSNVADNCETQNPGEVDSGETNESADDTEAGAVTESEADSNDENVSGND
ncbi:DUF3027 domain-containing protein [Bifidobacterium sp. ESL0728]|uniref:DUF3027 domain-containing protein n=1 Tax=Bifidobacterium sp. ESL0728 TaxID=2983220 RepID=UPI0023F87C3F|nr:DUF3027 domain-containing protein [Bifidobacterium sp. ESL0728]WEV58346.1 DUF3027 domain-containing protein [Bifidobacterium sp. ESL0728]